MYDAILMQIMDGVCRFADVEGHPIGREFAEIVEQAARQRSEIAAGHILHDQKQVLCRVERIKLSHNECDIHMK